MTAIQMLKDNYNKCPLADDGYIPVTYLVQQDLLAQSILELNDKVDNLTRSTADALLQIATALDSTTKEK